MMEIKQLREKVSDANSDVRGAEIYLSDARKVYRAAVTEYSNAIAMKYYSLQIGDVIEWDKKSWKKSEPSTVRIQITEFSAFTRNELGYEDEHPTITGTIIKKDGTLGTRDATYFRHSDGEFRVIQQATPAA